MNQVNILIVEDESLIALAMQRDLENIKKSNFKVTECVTNYAAAIESVKRVRPDIICMDIDLKRKEDGIDTAYAIHEIYDIPIIYLTAYADDDTIRRASDTNPIAYLNKPYKIDDLKTNILLASHKSSSKNKEITNEPVVHEEIGDGYTYDIKHQNLYFEDTPIRLSMNEKKLLTILIEARGNVVTFEDLEFQIWSDKPVSNSALRTLIYRLRGKLEHKFIETITGFGCKLIINE